MAAPPTNTAADKAAMIAGACQQAKATSTGWQVCCPAHEDSHPSLSIGYEGERVLLHCHAGCSVEAICASLMLTVADLFCGEKKGKLPIVATYDYTDEHGTLLFQACRLSNKSFFQRQPAPAGGWTDNIKGVRRVLYRLPEVVAAVARRTEPIYIVEGEKDVDNLRALGLTATCNPMGAGKWNEDTYAHALYGADCILLPDHDQVGADHMRHVARQLYNLTRTITIVPGIHTAKKGSDVSDWLAAGGTRAQLETIVQGTPLTSSAPPIPFHAAAPPGANGSHAPEPSGTPGSFNPDNLYTEHYNALALIKAHRHDMRYCFDWKCWMVWNGTHWLKDTSGQMMRWAKATVKDLARLLPTLDDKQAFALLAHIKSSLATAKLKAMIESAQSEEGLQISPADFDTNHWLLTCANGTVDLRLGTLRDPNRNDFITKCIPITYASQAQCPTWRTFLTRIMKHDTALVDFLQRAIGYSLTGDTREQCLFMLYGTGANGKSTFLDVVQSLLGVYAQSTPASTLLTKHGLDAVSNDIARLHGARFLSVTEISEGKRLNEALIKKLTGNDVLTGRFLYAEFFDFKGAFKIWIACNHKPMLEGTDYAMKRRIKVVPFEVTFKDDAEGELHQDKTLPEKLQAELSGILVWAIDGCLKWQANGDKGLDFPEKVVTETITYFNSMDDVGRFIDDMCLLPPAVPSFAKAKASTLYKTYQNWCKTLGEEEKSQRAVGMSLTERGFIRKPERDGIYWHGLALRDTEH
jgi:putative DNA primase/helicase